MQYRSETGHVDEVEVDEMSKQVLKDRAEALLALHQPGNPVILPTVWDAWSARLAVDAGLLRADHRQPSGRGLDRQGR